MRSSSSASRRAVAVALAAFVISGGIVVASHVTTGRQQLASLSASAHLSALERLPSANCATPLSRLLR